MTNPSMLKQLYWRIRKDRHVVWHVLRLLASFGGNYLRLLWLRHVTARGRPLVAISLVEHMGDIVAAEPLSRYVREAYPDAHIVWFVRAAYRELIDTNPAIDQTFVVECLTEWIKWRENGAFETVVDLHIRNRICEKCHIPLKKHEANQAISLTNFFDFGNLLEIQAQNAGFPVADGQPQLHIPRETVERVDLLKLPGRYIAVHCSSNESVRDWPADRWRELFERIGEFGKVDVVEIGLAAVISAKPKPGYVNLCGTISPLESAEVIRRAVLFVGIDSGPAHMANAVGTFGVILLGKYKHFKKYMPYSGRYQSGENAMIIFEETGLNNLSVDKVADGIRAHMRRVCPKASEALAGDL